ncbi:hypothetical protein CCP3SC15_240030 [Gammaproteobacteria bacterium]
MYVTMWWGIVDKLPVGLVVANNMVMEAETAHVLQTCRMLAAFGQVASGVGYLWPDFGPRVSVLDTLPVIRHPIPCRFRYGVGRYAEFVLRLWHRLRVEKNPAAVPLLFTRSLGVALMAQRVVPRVVLELHQGLSPRARRVASWLGPRVRVVAISNGLRHHLVEIDSFAQERVTVCHDGVEVARFATATPFSPDQRPLPERSTRWNHLYYGTMRPERGLDLLRYAAERLPDHGFVLVGGSQTEVAETLAAGLALPNVRVMPAIPHHEIPRLIRSFDTVLLPYTRAVKTYRWMSPLKLFEVMASGIPAVVSRLPSITEVVNDDHVNFIDSDDPESLVATLRTIEAAPAAAHARAVMAQARAVAFHSWERRAQDILAFAGD